NTCIDIEECIIHVQGPEIHFDAKTCVNPAFPVADSSVFVGYSTPSDPSNEFSGLVIQASDFTTAQRRRLLPLARVQAEIGKQGPGSEISEKGILDLRDIGSEFEWRFFKWVKEAIGSIFEKGGLITENAAEDRHLDISAAVFFDGEISEETFPTMTNISGIVLLHSPLGNWSTIKPIAALEADNINVDSATGLVAMTNNNKFASHSILMSPEGVDGRPSPRFFLIYSQGEFDSQSEAEAAGINFGPFIDQATSRLVPLAQIIQQKNVANFASVIDRRPVVGAQGGAISGSTDLQSSYNASTGEPEILTDATRNDLTVRYGGNNGKIFEAQKNDGTPVFTVYTSGNIDGITLDYILIRDEKTSGTSGGTCTSGSWLTRDLTTEVSDTGDNAILSSNQIALTAGTYQSRITATAFRVDRHQARLRNITDSTDIEYGTSEISNDVDAYASNKSEIITRFTIPSTKTLEIQHQCQTTQASIGFGLAVGGAFTTEREIYTIVELWKEK
ncbi:MAG: hypothetical protein JRF02_01090, partial [Deltaproteobacteria bacterium]|nr:hypothetical protein [Deltaproteobacteria bacterium]